MPGRPAFRALSAMPAALVFSLGAHALLVGLLWFCPASQSPPSSGVLDTAIEITLGPLPADHAPPSLPGEEQDQPPEHGGEAIAFDTSPASPAPAGAGDRAPTLMGHPGLSPGPSHPGSSGPAAGTARQLLQVPASAHSVVYLVDRSVSMGLKDALPLACRAVADSLAALPPSACFQVIAYNEQAEPLRLQGAAGLLPATSDNISQARHFLEELTASGETRHLLALQRGLTLQPDLLFLLTDADDLTASEVRTITRINQGRTRIHTRELSHHFCPDGLLAHLARANGGTYCCIRPQP